MPAEQPAMPMTDEERTYIALRVVLLALGIGLYLLDYIPAQMALQHQLSMLALVLTGLGTAALILAAVRFREPVSRTMMWVLPVDLVSIVIYTWALAPHDAFFGVCVLLVVFYAMIVARRNAVIAAVAISAAYLLGQVLSPAENVFGFALIALETATLSLVGVVVANAVARHREKELEGDGAVQERELINEQLERRVAELQAVAEITEIIHSSLDFDEVGPHVLEIISKVIGFSSLAVLVLDKDESETLFSASVGVPHDESMQVEGALGLGEIEAHLTCLRVFDHGSMMVLFCATAEDMERLTEDDRLVIYALASELVVAVENSRLYKLTRRLAVTDELTGMSNYRYLQQRLDDEVSRAKRYGKHLSLLMMDADDFKALQRPVRAPHRRLRAR